MRFERRPIVKIFKDAPASGWSGVDRPQFNEMLQYLHANRNANLMFFDYSRFYRRAALGILEFEKLDQAGIFSVSVCNSTVDCRTAGGRTERRRLLNEAKDFSLKEKWELKHGDSTTAVSRLSAQLGKEKDTRRNLLLKHDLKASLDSTIESLEMQIEESTMARATFYDLLTFTMKLPQNLGKIWETLPVDMKQKVQNTLIPGGLKCDPQKRILNEDSQCVFNQLREFCMEMSIWWSR